jgi:hypothetical protein
MAMWDDVRALAGRLPGAEEGTSYREPCFRVGGKTFVNMSPHEPGALVVRVEPEERPLLLGARPDVYFVTPHYAAYPLLLVRLGPIDPEELAERVTDAWLLRAPAKLAAAYMAEPDNV